MLPEQAVQNNRRDLQEARSVYAAAISTRASSQREVNELLQRKHAWSPQDLERFTALYRSDHANEQAESSARNHLAKVEEESEDAAAKLNACILSRYHEEQIWSDKIRRMSTWGTWSLMGVNILLFLIFQIGIEPWKRQRLVSGIEEKVRETLVAEATGSSGILKLRALNDDSNGDGPEIVDIARKEEVFAHEEPTNLTIPSTEKPDPTDDFSSTDSFKAWLSPQGILDFVRSCLSDQQLLIRKRDLTAAIIQGVAAGLAFVGLSILYFRPR